MSEEVTRLLESDRTLALTMEGALSAYAASDFVSAARLSFEVLRQEPSHLAALVCFARSLQLADEEATREFNLGDVRTALEKAVALHSTTADPAHELAWFLFAVDDNDQAALDVVERALAARMAQLRDLLVLKIEILRDLERNAEAHSVAQAALRIFSDDAELRAALG